jgi:hypothetical protein
MARPARLELATLCLEGRRSIQLSYGRIVIDFKANAVKRHIVLLAVPMLRGEGSPKLDGGKVRLPALSSFSLATR